RSALGVDVGDEHLHPRSGEAHRDPPPDPAPAADDDGSPALQVVHHPGPLNTRVGHFQSGVSVSHCGPHRGTEGAPWPPTARPRTLPTPTTSWCASPRPPRPKSEPSTSLASLLPSLRSVREIFRDALEVLGSAVAARLHERQQVLEQRVADVAQLS